jgi:uncharacterized paraquat-inducible protein A
MDSTSYLERWTWLGLALLVFALLSPPAVVVGLALWLWLHWQRQARWRWVVAGLLLLASWAGLVLFWGALADQLVALREAITGYVGVGALLTRALPVWGEGTLLGPTIAGLVQLFRPQKPNKPTPTQHLAQPASPAQPTQSQLSGVTRRLTLPSPAVRSDQPPDASELAS